MKELSERAAREFVDFSWEDRRRIAICTFVEALEEGYDRRTSYEFARVACRVAYSTARKWVQRCVVMHIAFNRRLASPPACLFVLIITKRNTVFIKFSYSEPLCVP